MAAAPTAPSPCATHPQRRLHAALRRTRALRERIAIKGPRLTDFFLSDHLTRLAGRYHHGTSGGTRWLFAPAVTEGAIRCCSSPSPAPTPRPPRRAASPPPPPPPPPVP